MVWKEINPVQVYPSLNLDNFSLEKYSTRNGLSKQTITGSYAYIELNFVFKRLSNYYLVAIYIPSAMLVIVSFFSFWVDIKNQVLKCTINLAGLSTLALLLTLMNTSLPHVSYTKAIDLWTGVCITFIFAAFAESIIVYYRHLINTGNATDENQLDKHVSICVVAFHVSC